MARNSKKSLNDALSSALPAHYRQLRGARALRRDLMRDYVGTLFPGRSDLEDAWSINGQDALTKKHILNLTFEAAQAHVMALAANRPRFLCDSKASKHRVFAQHMQRALNRYSARLYLEEVLQEIVRDSFFGLGIGKMCHTDSLATNLEVDYRMDPGQPFFARSSQDHVIWDTNGTCLSNVTFIADRYRVLFDHLTARLDGGKKASVKDIGPQRLGDMESEELGENIANKSHYNAEEVEDFIWLSDVYLPAKHKVCTYVVDHEWNLLGDGKPIYETPWTGEEQGPFYFLNMGPVPDHILCTSPGQNQKLLAELVNSQYRKLEEMAALLKVVHAYNAAAEEDAERLRAATNGEYVPMTNGVENIASIRTDGPDSQLHGFMLDALQQHSRSAGNLIHRLGLGAQADTAAQEGIIGKNVSEIVAFQQKRYESFLRSVARGLARLLFEDQVTEIPGTFEIPNSPQRIVVDDTWMGAGVKDREAPFGAFDVDIDPFSLQYKSPGERAAFLDQMVTKWMPYMPFMTQLGIQPDIKAYFEEMANLTDTPALKRVFKFDQQPLPPEPAVGQVIGGGGQREYIHRSAGPQGQSPAAADPAKYMAQGASQNVAVQ
jgi:hypothetical protein